MTQISSKIDKSYSYIRFLLCWEATVRDYSIDKYNTFHFCGWLMQRPRDKIAPADPPLLLSSISFRWTAVLLLFLRKAFCTFPVNSTTPSLSENWRGKIQRRVDVAVRRRCRGYMGFAKRPSLLRRRTFSNCTADVHAGIPEALAKMMGIKSWLRKSSERLACAGFLSRSVRKAIRWTWTRRSEQNV